jgi:hypothetical protein
MQSRIEGRIEERYFLELAGRASSGMSFSPEKRAKREFLDYIETVEKFEAMGVNTDKLNVLWCDKLHAQSRLFSPMISGPARFPVARMEKHHRWADAKVSKLLEYIEKVLNPKIPREMIRKSDCDAVEKMIEKIAHLESEKIRIKALKPCDREHSFSLQYATNAVKEAKARLALIERNQSRDDNAFEIGEIRVVQSWNDNRVRLFFPGKPDEETRSSIKRNGFRWTPSLGCWQAFNNARSVDFVREMRMKG